MVSILIQRERPGGKVEMTIPSYRRPAVKTMLDGLDLENYYLFQAVRADMLRQLGRDDDAATADEAAIARTNNLTEREYMQRRLDGLESA